MLASDQAFLNAVRHILFAAIIVVILSGLVQALLRGSRAARFQAVAWFPILVVGGIATIHEIAWNSEWPLWASAILVVLTFEVVVSAVGVSDRFMILRRERDEAIAGEVVAARIAGTDPLTGLPNRRGLAAHIKDSKHQIPSAVAILDIDYFKAINDKYGHDVGDKALVAVASVLFRQDCFVARVGGEEFAILIYSDTPDIVANSLRHRISNSVKSHAPEICSPVTASVGLFHLHPNDSVAHAIKQADKVLYRAKNAGRDRLVSVTASPAETSTDASADKMAA